ncbi:MAG: TRAP transporter large permease [Sporomusaceae bacterium]|nr:TRAP transporter large permease [Sporomusaceae bacterium]
MISLILFGAFIFLLAVGAPIGVALGLATVVALLVDGTVTMTVVAQKILAANNSFPLLAVPFFMFAGAVMTEGGISKRLIDFVYTLVGSIRGGLAMVATVTAMFFAAISGSSAATCAAIGSSLIPAMKQKGYDEEYSAAVIAAAGTTGIVIPPSTPMVVYGVVAGVSIGELFLGGFIPGILMGLAMMVVIYFQAKKRGYVGEKRSDIKTVWKTFIDASWGLMMPVIILGGIYGGIFTPTESAAIASFYGLFVTLFIYKEKKFADIPKIMGKAVVATAIVMFIISMAGLFSWILTANRIPQAMAALFLSLTTNPLYIMMLINVLLLFVGTFLNATAAISILVPVLFPVITKVGIDPVAFGVIMTVNLAIGCITPPVGVDLFVAQSISGISIERITRSVFPLLMALIGVLLLVTFVPELILLIPSTMK